MISRQSTLVYETGALGVLLGYVGLVAVARFIPDSEEILDLVGFGLGGPPTTLGPPWTLTARNGAVTSMVFSLTLGSNIYPDADSNCIFAD